MEVSPSSFARVITVPDHLGEDIHMGNILFRVPELDGLSLENIATKFGQPSIGKV